MIMPESKRGGSGAYEAYVLVALAGAAGTFLVTFFGGRCCSGWPPAAMVAAPAAMAVIIAYSISRTRVQDSP
jgi:hypothetical protein